MSIFGFDLSTSKIAIARLSIEGFEVVELTSKCRSWEARFKELYWLLSPWIRDFVTVDDLICIEDIPLVQNRQTLIKLVHILAMCRTICTEYGMDVFTVNVKTWKKDVVGDGSSDKDKVKAMAVKIFGKSVNKLSQDSVDALMIAKWGELRLNTAT